MMKFNELRKVDRLPLRWPVRLWKRGDVRIVETLTSNLSEAGLYCISQDAFLPGEELECVIEVPAKRRSFGEEICSMHCQVVVVRVEARGVESGFGIACRILNYMGVFPRYGQRKLKEELAKSL